MQSSFTFELSAGLALIKDESLRNIDVAVRNHFSRYPANLTQSPGASRASTGFVRRWPFRNAKCKTAFASCLSHSVTFGQSLEQLTNVMESSSRLLETSLLQAKTAQDIHSDTMVSMDRLVETVHSLTQTTQTEIASINRSSFALKESFNRPPDSEWLKAILVSLLQLFPG